MTETNDTPETPGSAPETAPPESPPAAPDALTDWRAGLPPEVAEWQEVQTAKDANDLWKQMEHYRSAYGRSIRVPTEDAGEEDRQKFFEKLRQADPSLTKIDTEDAEAMKSLYATLGKPDDPAKYKAPEIAEQFDADQIARFKHIANQADLTQSQFERVLGSFLQNESEARQAQQAELAEGRTILREELGLAYEPKIGKAARVAEQFGFPQEVIAALKDGNMGASSTRAFISMAEQFKSEGVNMGDAPPSSSMMLTPDDAREQMRQIRDNKDHPYWHASKPGHAAAKKKMRELSVMAQGGDNKEIDLQPATIGRG